MGASLTQQRRVKEEGLRIVNFCCQRRNKTVTDEKAPANYVPAAAVIRRGRALSGMTGRKGCVGGLISWKCNTQGLTRVLLPKLSDLSVGEDSGIPSVAVECVDIRRNISGEGDYLDDN